MWLRTTNGGVSRRQTCCTRSIATKVDESRPARHYAAGMMFWLTRNALAESYLLFTAAGRARLSPTTRSSALPKRIVSHPSWWAPRQVQVPGLVQIAGLGERGRAREEGRLEVGLGEIGAGEIGVGGIGSRKGGRGWGCRPPAILAIDSKLRACDLVKLRLDDVAPEQMYGIEQSSKRRQV